MDDCGIRLEDLWRTPGVQVHQWGRKRPPVLTGALLVLCSLPPTSLSSVSSVPSVSSVFSLFEAILANSTKQQRMITRVGVNAKFSFVGISEIAEMAPVGVAHGNASGVPPGAISGNRVGQKFPNLMVRSPESLKLRSRPGHHHQSSSHRWISDARVFRKCL